MKTGQEVAGVTQEPIGSGGFPLRRELSELYRHENGITLRDLVSFVRGVPGDWHPYRDSRSGVIELSLPGGLQPENAGCFDQRRARWEEDAL
jgi:hypothetical protein